MILKWQQQSHVEQATTAPTVPISSSGHSAFFGQTWELVSAVNVSKKTAYNTSYGKRK